MTNTRAATILAELQAVLDRHGVNLYLTIAEIRERGINGVPVALIETGRDTDGRVPLREVG